MAQRHHGGRGRIERQLDAELSAIQKQNPTTRSHALVLACKCLNDQVRYRYMDFETFYKQVGKIKSLSQKQ